MVDLLEWIESFKEKVNLMKNKFDKMKEINDSNTKNIIESVENVYEVKKKIEKTNYLVKNVNIIISDLDRQFENATKLKQIDISFLFLATALQLTRQFLTSNSFTKESRLTDKQAAGSTNYDRNFRGDSLYTTTIEEIWSNPVPFDTQNGAPGMGVNLGGGREHRIRTVGHDPVLGLIFGTANIATRTMTVMPSFSSYHIKYGNYKTSKGHISTSKNDYLDSPANTLSVLDRGLVERLKHPLIDNNIGIVISSLAKEMTHLASDWNSKESLSLPFTAINPAIAKKISDRGVDMASVGTVLKQASYAEVINQIIFLTHKLLISSIEIEENSQSLIEVRGRKILTYSNLMASGVNLAYVGIVGDINKLDIGGILVAIYRLVTSRKYQQEEKKRFLKEGLYEFLDTI